MALRVVGAGVGRTGTHSLKLGLERLLGAPCYHMIEVFQRPEHVPVWKAAAREEAVDWDSLFTGYAAAVDWPASAFWPELAKHNPGALVIFSRRDPAAWWESANATIFSGIPKLQDTNSEWFEMVQAVFDLRFTTQINDREACIAAYKLHEEEVLKSVPKDRLVVWEACDGWGPLCSALNLPIPDEQFPKVNTKEEFIARLVANQGPKTE